MAQFYTLEEAAIKLGMSNEEFRRRLRDDWKTLRSLRDGATLRFRSADIEDLARSLGRSSEPELQLTDSTPLSLSDSSDEMLILEDTPPKKPKSAPKKPTAKEPEPLKLDDSDETIFTVPAVSSGSGVGKRKAKGDSDVKLDASDDDMDLSAGPRSGILKAPSSGKLKGPSSGKLSAGSSTKLKGPGSGKIPGPKASAPTDEGSSEFELSLEDSGSDSFELTLNTDSSEEVDIGGAIKAEEKGGQSGIDLARPSDSGVSLEKRGAKSKPKLVEDEGSSEFDLALDSGSESDFELKLEDSNITDSLVEDDAEKSTGDIFETDFELPAVGDDSASQVVAIDSDTDLELNEDVVVDEENPDYEVTIDEDEAPVEEESASQVMIMDDDEGVVAEEEENAFAMDGDGYTPEEGSAADELAGVHHEGEEDTIPIRTVVAQPAKWGVVPTLFLVPSLLVLVVGGLMCLEVVRGMWGYQQPVRTNDSLLRGVAGAFDVKVAD